MKSINDIVNESKTSVIYVYFEFGTSGWGAKPIIRVNTDPFEVISPYSEMYTKEAWLYRLTTNSQEKKIFDTFYKLDDWKNQSVFEKTTLNDICQDWDKVKLPGGEDKNEIKKLVQSL